MPSSTAHRLEDALDVAAPTRAPSPYSASEIAIEIADAAALASVRPDWTDLLTRSDTPNMFMDPALVGVAARTDPSAEHRAVLAWKSIDGTRTLVGFWAVAVGYARKSPLPIRILRVPACPYGALATPVIDRDYLDETLDAMLDGIAAAPQLPNIVTLDAIGTDDPVYAALIRVLNDRGCVPYILHESRRPRLVFDGDAKTYLEQNLSSSTRKKLRQHRRKLASQGALTSVVATEPNDVHGLMEDFLTTEAAGWKGRQGTALLNDAADAAFMRGAMAALAEQGCASIHALCLDGKPLSLQIVGRAGSTAFTWKTTYDEAFQDFSPGMLLLEDYTSAFLDDKSITSVDSCSLDDTGFMSAWGERQPVADIWIDAQRGGSLTFRVLARLQKSYRNARAAAKDQYYRWQRPPKR